LEEVPRDVSDFEGGSQGDGVTKSLKDTNDPGRNLVSDNDDTYLSAPENGDADSPDATLIIEGSNKSNGDPGYFDLKSLPLVKHELRDKKKDADSKSGSFADLSKKGEVHQILRKHQYALPSSCSK
jgi:hypothetical protein